MVDQTIFFGLVLLLIFQRILELMLSGRNERWVIVQGGFEVGPGHTWVMKGLHVLWFISMVVEVIWFKRRMISYITVIALVVFLIGQGLRYAAIITLKKRWTVKVMVLPGATINNQGIYRWLRHPNYLGVILEIAAFPLIGNAWITSLVFSLANALLLIYRIRVEEDALGKSNHYKEIFDHRPRFIPLESLISWVRRSKHEDRF